MGATRRKFTPQYRRDAARLVIDSGRTARAVADEIGVGEQLLGRWVANERARMEDPPPAVDINERAELERLRAENTQLRMDREFLKKAAAYPGDRCHAGAAGRRCGAPGSPTAARRARSAIRVSPRMARASMLRGGGSSIIGSTVRTMA